MRIVGFDVSRSVAEIAYLEHGTLHAGGPTGLRYDGLERFAPTPRASHRRCPLHSIHIHCAASIRMTACSPRRHRTSATPAQHTPPRYCLTACFTSADARHTRYRTSNPSGTYTTTGSRLL